MISTKFACCSDVGVMPLCQWYSHTKHACTAGDGDVGAGDVPLSALQAQIQVLNSAFADTPFTFLLAGVDRHTNASVRRRRCLP